MRSGEHAKHEHGFVYIALLIGLTIISIGLGATSEVWTQSRQREKEEELLFIGNQFRLAITRFYQQSPPAARRFPLTLEELVDDNRAPDKPAHYLRRLYTDPMTGDTKWGEVRLASGQLVGVYSQSNSTPFKVHGFALRDMDFVDKDRYSDWIFRSALPAANPLLAAGAGYTGPGGTPGKPGPGTAPGGAPGAAPGSAPGAAPATTPGFGPGFGPGGGPGRTLSPQLNPNTPTPPGFILPTPRPRR
jgi:type II secretory pathway pseudopilin PulG